MKRTESLLKLANQILSSNERFKINEALFGAQGFDYIRDVLSGFGFSIGQKIGKNKFALLKGKDIITNVLLKGNHEGMQIISNKSTDTKIPWDARYTPASIYDEWERKNEK